MSTHYETLGLTPNATPDEVKSAYRKLARQYHPDVNQAADANNRFLEVQKAYEVLSDDRRRVAYDQIIGIQRQAEDKREREQRQRTKEEQEAEDLRRRAEERMKDAPSAPNIDQSETDRLLGLMQGNKFAEAETLARAMLQRESRQPVPYAVLGDIARFRGETSKAIEYFGYAAQYEPRNTLYQRKYEELVTGVGATTRSHVSNHLPEPAMPPLLVAGGLCVVLACYVAIAPEPALGLRLVPRWTLGMIVSSLVSGLSMGIGLSLSGLLDNFKTATGATVTRFSPATFVALISVASFWIGAGYYFVLGQTQGAFNRSVSCVIGASIAIVVALSLAGLAKGPDFALQNFLWAGNLVYLSCCLGWCLTDGFKNR